MKCELLSIGTELLTGATLNTNVNYLSKELSAIGVDVHYHTTIGDNPKRLRECLDIAVNRVDCVIITGGLGPTQDDLTKETVASFFNMPLKRDDQQVIKLKKRFENSGYPLTENNFRQCDIPVGAAILDNSCGTAPGIHIEKNNVDVFMLPGVPREMKAMFTESVLPVLKSKSNQIVTSRYYNICDMGESQIENQLLDLIKQQTNPTIATYAGVEEVTVRITAGGTDAAEIKKLLDQTESIINERFGSRIFSRDRTTLSKTVGELLKAKGLSLSTAESCTGGQIAAALTAIPGISEVYETGFVTYSNNAKKTLLGVPSDILDTYGAVSHQTAEAMCQGLLERTGSDLAVSVTGIAGPGGGSEAKPVGLVYIGVADHQHKIIEKCQFNGDRHQIQRRSVNKAFAMLRNLIITHN